MKKECIIESVAEGIVLYNGNSKYIIPNIKENLDYIITNHLIIMQENIHSGTILIHFCYF